MMYEALVARIQYHIQKANFMGLKEHESTRLLNEAADAIEELQGKTKVLEKLADHWCNKAPKWIPVTEQLPPISEEVIVFADRTIIRIWSLERYHPTIADVFWEREDGYHEDADVVSHWMPLPEPPKDGEE